jgi:CcmD family protein
MLAWLVEGPKETTIYMIAGYAVIFTVLVLYLISLVVRRANLKRDLETLENMGVGYNGVEYNGEKQ